MSADTLGVMKILRYAAAGLLLCACGDSSAEDGAPTEGDLTCELLQDPNNCWAQAAAETAACLPGVSPVGALAADRASCTFSDGSRVVFDDGPLPLETFELERLAITFEKDGAECARFVDTFSNRMELEAGGQFIVSELHAGSEFHLHCAEDETLAADFDLLFECPPFSGPTDGFLVEADRVEFTIVSVATPGVLFTCIPE